MTAFPTRSPGAAVTALPLCVPNFACSTELANEPPVAVQPAVLPFSKPPLVSRLVAASQIPKLESAERPSPWIPAAPDGVGDLVAGALTPPPGGGVVLVTGWPLNAAASLPARSWTGLVAGTVYETVTVSPLATPGASVSVTADPPIPTALTVRGLALTTTA